MKTLAIITARGGSKRIPRKNIRPFNGKPIIAYSIEAAIESGVFDTVMVSTDDDEIADTAVRYGATVPFRRSAATSDDHATTSDVLEEVLNVYAGRGEKYDIAACIYPTAPFIPSARLREGVEMLQRSSADTLMPVVRYSYPPQRAYEIEDGMLKFRAPEYMDARSQDLVPWYHDAGQFYIFRTERFLETHRITAGEILPLEISDMEVQDIDTETDWTLAELKYRLLHEV